MPVKYSHIVPWGRNLDEYRAMFHLTEDDLERSILGCGDGPASFNCEMNRMGYKVVSVDPVYQYSREEIEKRIDETAEIVIEQTTNNSDKYCWNRITSIEELKELRLNAMNLFLQDFTKGENERRYICAELPRLPLENSSFDLALSSHFLFLYSDNLDYNFHKQSVYELLRVSKEVRIFPIVDNSANESRHLKPLLAELESDGYDTAISTVDYEFQRGGNHMLQIKTEVKTF